MTNASSETGVSKVEPTVVEDAVATQTEASTLPRSIVYWDTEYMAWNESLFDRFGAQHTHEEKWDGLRDPQEIIQIGAVRWDLHTDTITPFVSTIKPLLSLAVESSKWWKEKIANGQTSESSYGIGYFDYVTKLTGISEDKLRNPDTLSFPVALESFVNFIFEQAGDSGDVVLYSWGPDDAVVNRNLAFWKEMLPEAERPSCFRIWDDRVLPRANDLKLFTRSEGPHDLALDSHMSGKAFMLAGEKAKRILDEASLQVYGDTQLSEHDARYDSLSIYAMHRTFVEQEKMPIFSSARDRFSCPETDIPLKEIAKRVMSRLEERVGTTKILTMLEARQSD